MRQLSSLDALFLALENDRNYGHVGSVAILDPSTIPGGAAPSVERTRELLASRLHLVAPFTSRLATVPFDLDLPYWVPDEHFDLGYHCREIALPAPGSMDQLRDQVARIYSRRLDRSRPLWELYLIHGLSGGRVAVCSKVHHAAVDGMSGGEILTMLYDVSPEPREVDPPAADGDGSGTDELPGGMGLLLRSLRALPGAPLRTADRLGRLLPHVDVVPSVFGVPGAEMISRAVSRARATVGRDDSAKVIARPRIRPARGAFDGRVSPHRIFGLGSVSLTDVKRVKDHFGAKVNDVVVTLVAAAVREYMTTHDFLPAEPLVAQLPVSVRTEEERGTFGNQVSAMFVAIPTHLPDPVERLRFSMQQIGDAKERHGALPAKALRDVTQFIPPALHARASRTVVELLPRIGMTPPFNIIISNVPGPPIDIYSGGMRLEALFPLSIIADGATLNVTVMSYRDSIDIGITADREHTPDVQTMVDAMQRALDELVSLV